MNGSRRIVYDAEATGGSAEDRLIEIALVEMVGHACTGRTWVTRLDPEGRLVHPGAFRIHGIADADLVGAPRFADKVGEIFDFIGDARIFMHGALDDRRMLDRELARAGLPAIDPERTVDTVRLARIANPGETRHGLDALVARFRPQKARGLHGALEDARLLAAVMPFFTPPDDADLDLPSRPAPGGRARRQPLPAPAPGEGVDPDLAARAARAVTLEDALALRLEGLDGWTRVARPELLAGLSSRHDPRHLQALVADLSDRRQLYALRWMGRGLAPELAAARERDLDRRERQPSPPALPGPE